MNQHTNTMIGMPAAGQPVPATAQTMTREIIWRHDGIAVSVEMASSGEAGREIFQELEARLEDLATRLDFAELLTEYQKSLGPVDVVVDESGSLLLCPVCGTGILAANIGSAQDDLQGAFWNPSTASVMHDTQEIYPEEDAPIESLVCTSCTAEIATNRYRSAALRVPYRSAALRVPYRSAALRVPCRFIQPEPKPDLLCLECRHRFSAVADWTPDLTCPECGSPDIMNTSED